MTPAEITKLTEENKQLHARLRRLADEKSNLQLVVRLIEQLNPLPGIKDMVRAMLHNIVETIGGTDIKIYYWIEGELHYAAFLGEGCILPAIDDALAAKVVANGEFVEEPGATDSALLQGDVVPGAWNWGFPLLLGKELIGVIKLENLHISGASLRTYLPIFFSHAALILSNEIRNFSRIKAEEAFRVNEERLKLATTAGKIGIWDWDIVRNVLTWDESMYALYGIRKEDFSGAYDAWLQTLHPDDREFASAETQAALRGEREYAPEFRIIRPDGTILNIKASAKIFFAPQGKPTRMIGTNFDITDIKQTENELRQYKDHLEEEVQERTADLVLARDAAEAANKAKSAFLSSMSHELRTPLNAILGFSSLMRKDLSITKSQSDNLDIINRSGEHLLTLINDVLEVAKIEAGRVQLENSPFDLGGMVRDVADMMEIRAKEKGLQLLLDQSSEFPRYIFGDEARLRQILINLISNAVKFTLQGGVTIRLGTKQNKISHLLIEVEDSGPGISAENQQRLFQPFVQLGKQIGDNKGTGLGLAITQQFVQLMGGAIGVESTPGKGSLFRVELPLIEVKEADIAKPKEVRGDVVGLAPGQPEYRILIVEDQLENQLLLANLMRPLGFQVKTAENGEQGVQFFQSWHPHLIWMDRRMPVMEGMEATKAIRKLPGGKEVKIVAVTASAFMEQRDEMLKAGMDDFVRKPYRFDEIYACLTRHLGVQYIYAETQNAEVNAPPAALTAAMLAVLPAELRSELRSAVESLEEDRIHAAIQQVETYDSNLHKSLSYLAGNFDYPSILKALLTI